MRFAAPIALRVAPDAGHAVRKDFDAPGEASQVPGSKNEVTEKTEGTKKKIKLFAWRAPS